MTQPPYLPPDQSGQAPNQPGVPPYQPVTGQNPPAAAWPPGTQPFQGFAPAPPPKKRKTGLFVVLGIVGLVVALVAGFFVYQLVFAHRGTAYCQTYISIQDDILDMSKTMEGLDPSDLGAIAPIFRDMTSAFERLQNAEPPAEIADDLATIVDYWAQMATAAETGDIETFAHLATTGATEFATASQAIDDFTVEYCN